MEKIKKVLFGVSLVAFLTGIILLMYSTVENSFYAFILSNIIALINNVLKNNSNDGPNVQRVKVDGGDASD